MGGFDEEETTKVKVRIAEKLERLRRGDQKKNNHKYLIIPKWSIK